MDILMCSFSFPPSIGGIETVSRILAHQFVDAGHKVKVATYTPGPNFYGEVEVLRSPSGTTLRNAAKGADVIFQNNISLRLLKPISLTTKPIVITHQTWLTRIDGRSGWQDKVKAIFLNRCKNISISKAIAQSIPISSTLIPNPYEADDFLKYRVTHKDKDLVFMGRLVSDKGCDLLLEALSHLRRYNLEPTLTIIGDGSERATLEILCKSLGLEKQVAFVGSMSVDRAAEVARHKIMVVPSRWREPFGVVALEGIAAGCAIVASSGGGLPDAVGPCGLLYQNNSIDALVDALKRLLTDPDLQEHLVAEGPDHLKHFHPKVVAASYLDLFSSLINKGLLKN